MRLTYALLFKNLGSPIIPCYRNSKAFLQGHGPQQLQPLDDKFLYSWLKDQGNNYALATGHAGLIVLDFDSMALYDRWAAEVGCISDTFTVATFRGYHVYYRSDDLRSWKAEGVEVLASGKAVMGPYSMHPEGGLYLPFKNPQIRLIDTVSDLPFLIDTRPVLPKPPEKPPERINSPGQGKSIIAEIKATWGIADALQQLQPRTFKTLRGSGRWLTGNCPFHDDHHPSFWIDRQRDLFGCHACDARGDVINLVALTYGISSKDAIRSIKATGQLVRQGPQGAKNG